MTKAITQLSKQLKINFLLLKFSAQNKMLSHRLGAKSHVSLVLNAHKQPV